MRSDKRYSNVTFSKRVDHDGGRKREARGAAEPAVCAGCGAVYARRRWSVAPVPRTLRSSAAAPISVRVCPACRRKRTGVPRGFLHIDGEFFKLHGAEIERLVRNEAARARQDNPLGQVQDWTNLDGGGLLVTTSTEHLAQRLGRALEKAFDGHVRYGFSHENKLAHVWWRR